MWSTTMQLASAFLHLRCRACLACESFCTLHWCVERSAPRGGHTPSWLTASGLLARAFTARSPYCAPAGPGCFCRATATSPILIAATWLAPKVLF
ncbi:conserved hypothetical protein [Ricinus communis]|uniref:Secreted protein n=1 Tax=Ricinus communis TaxID=3988 RepID=B9SFQ5_RICCO|nr:conserved hypothetical protein [Ricinus communis]